MSTDIPPVLSRRDFAIAGVSFAVSGIGGAYFQKWLSKAKPSLEIVSFGFDGTPEPFKLSDELRQRSNEDAWGDTLNETSTFEELRKRYRSNLHLIRIHEALIPQVDKWLQQNKPRLSGSTSANPIQLTAAEIAAHSYFQDELMGSSLTGSIRRLQIGEPPISDFSKTDYPIDSIRQEH